MEQINNVCRVPNSMQRTLSSTADANVQRLVFDDEEFCIDWRRGEKKLANVATLLTEETQQSSESIVFYLRRGCMRLKENPAVMS